MAIRAAARVEHVGLHPVGVLHDAVAGGVAADDVAVEHGLAAAVGLQHRAGAVLEVGLAGGGKVILMRPCIL